MLAAVELALGGAPPSGRVSVEHVQNVLARLSAAPRPDDVVTALRASTPPRADTARYDTLRAGAGAERIAGCIPEGDATCTQEVDHA